MNWYQKFIFSLFLVFIGVAFGTVIASIKYKRSWDFELQQRVYNRMQKHMAAGYMDANPQIGIHELRSWLVFLDEEVKTAADAKGYVINTAFLDKERAVTLYRLCGLYTKVGEKALADESCGKALGFAKTGWGADVTLERLKEHEAQHDAKDSR
ncbi:MAG: hypothetical protein OEV59_05400 [Deltaproteobacteria bacterium]|nr:hypothetical protein [Deltaproteobacteria bacterium]